MSVIDSVTEINLLDYSFPYFIQDFIFCYRGKEIESLKGDVTWNQMLESISNEPRFKVNNSLPELAMIGDSRTIYSIARLVETEEDKSINVNPSNLLDTSIDELTTTYSFLLKYLNKLGNNALVLNPDSNVILNKLSNNEVNGAFLYNGDALYSYDGGDNGNTIVPDDFHVVKPKNTLVALDTIAISKNTSEENKEKAYKLIYDLLFNFGTSTEESMPYRNFEYTLYTPTTNVINNFAIANNPILKDSKGIDIYNIINFSTGNLLELPISSLVKSNLSFAYLNFKNSLK